MAARPAFPLDRHVLVCFFAQVHISDELQELTDRLSNSAREYGMEISSKRAKSWSTVETIQQYRLA